MSTTTVRKWLGCGEGIKINSVAVRFGALSPRDGGRILIEVNAGEFDEITKLERKQPKTVDTHAS